MPVGEANPKKEGSALRRRNTARAVAVVAILLIGTIGFWFGLRLVLGTQNPLFVVTSGSMIPSLNINDVVVITDGESFDPLKIDDIVIYYLPGSPHECITRIRNCIVHRINNITLESGEKALVTKGDSNRSPDPWLVREGDYIGKVVFVVPQLGLITRLLEPFTTPPINYVLIAVIIGLIFLIEFRGTGKRGKDSESDAENPASL